MNVDLLHIRFHYWVSSIKMDHLTWHVVYIINIIVSLKQNESFTKSSRKH